MKARKLILVLLVFSSFMPIISASGQTQDYSFQDKVTDTTSLFFVLDLSIDEQVIITLTHEKTGNFTLFLMNQRPVESNILLDKTLSNKIYENTTAFDLSEQPQINYTSTETKIFYLQVILISGGPDFFTLKSSKNIVRYYLPQIPGYPIEFLIVMTLVPIGIVLYISIKKRIKLQ